MTGILAQYDNPKLWKLDESRLPIKIYVSVPTEVPTRWKTEHLTGLIDMMFYRCGEYEIRGYEYGKRRPNGTVYRRTYSVRRQGVEIGGFTGLLKEAKQYAATNARGEYRVNVA